jgi:3-mercaptopyruvate sulfurtransferase SseA
MPANTLTLSGTYIDHGKIRLASGKMLAWADLEKLMGDSDIANDTTVILYGDNNNWFAAWAFWQLEMYGHKDIRIMDSGRKKWLAESRGLTKELPAPKKSSYKLPHRRTLQRRFEYHRRAGRIKILDALRIVHSCRALKARRRVPRADGLSRAGGTADSR